MKIELSADEVRVLGALIEKEITSPDQCPLSLNALTAACNQRSNRDPVVDWDEPGVQRIVDGLLRRYLLGSNSGHGNRVTKYRQRLINAEYGDLKLSERQVGILCELMLRGPQTPGELRVRCERLCAFADVGQVEAALESMINRDEPLVERLPREPGRRESRYRHLLCTPSGPVAAHATAGNELVDGVADTGAPATVERERAIETLHSEITALRAEVHELRARLELVERDRQPG